MPRRTPTKFRRLAEADEAPQPRHDHALDLDAAAAVAQALRAQQQAPRVEAKKPRSGGAFANTADEPQRPQQRSAPPPSAQPALRRGAGRFDLSNEIAAAREVDAPTAADDAREVQDAATHVRRRYAKPSAPFLGDDGLLQATFDGPRGVETAVVLFCERCGYGRTANDPETPDGNGFGEPNYKQTFGEGLYAQQLVIPLDQPTFVCRRCPNGGSRPYAVGGARRIAPPAPDIAIAIATPAAPKIGYEAPLIVEPPEAEARRKFWAQQAENRKNPDFQMALKQSTETAEEERNQRRKQLSVVPQGTPWKVLDLAKLEPPRREGLRALS